MDNRLTFAAAIDVAAAVVVAVDAVDAVVVAVVVADDDASTYTDDVAAVASVPSVGDAIRHNFYLGMEMTYFDPFVATLNCSIWLFWLTSLGLEQLCCS